MAIGKKGAIYGVITLMLCTAVYLNWSYSRDPVDLTVANEVSGEEKVYGETQLVDGESSETLEDVSETDAQDYFSNAKLSRDQARDEAISILKTTVDNENATDQSKNEANTQINTLAENSIKEATIESLILAKGYENVVVFLTSEDVNVIVSAPEEGFSSADAMRIKDIVVSEAGVTAEQIKIVEAG